MDYLLRDSLYTGVTYGQFDLQRLINTLLVDGDQVVSMAKGIVAIEEYLLARYFMYWQVYLHKTTRSQEVVLARMWQRAVDLWREGRCPRAKCRRRSSRSCRGEPTLGEYLAVDDHDVVYAAQALDPVKRLDPGGSGPALRRAAALEAGVQGAPRERSPGAASRGGGAPRRGRVAARVLPGGGRRLGRRVRPVRARRPGHPEEAHPRPGRNGTPPGDHPASRRPCGRSRQVPGWPSTSSSPSPSSSGSGPS